MVKHSQSQLPHVFPWVETGFALGKFLLEHRLQENREATRLLEIQGGDFAPSRSSGPLGVSAEGGQLLYHIAWLAGIGFSVQSENTNLAILV